MRSPTCSVLLFVLAVMNVAGCAAQETRAQSEQPVLFVCEHGNVKSLMAASYFDQMARERGIGIRAISRGSAPDSTTVPPAIIAALRDDGFDVAGFHPTAVVTADITASRHIVLIGTELPAGVLAQGSEAEHWNDVPPASVDYAAARESLKIHVARLIDQLAKPRR